MTRRPPLRLLGVSALLTSLLIPMLACALLAPPPPTPTPTPEPSPTPEPTPTAAPTATPLPRSTSTAPPARGLGVPRQTFQSYFESLGYRFTSLSPMYNLPTVQGADRVDSVTLHGPPEDVFIARLTINVIANPADHVANVLVSFLTLALPDQIVEATTWFSTAVLDVLHSGREETTIGRAQIVLEHPALGFELTVRALP